MLLYFSHTNVLIFAGIQETFTYTLRYKPLTLSDIYFLINI